MAKILIVDDSPTNREFLVILLGHLGHHLLQAADGAEALALVRAERPDLVISDILMPAMDGFALVRQLRADAALAAIPVIFCSAHYHERQARDLALACGVSAVLSKPCEPDVVLSTVAAVLSGTPPPTPPPAVWEFEREHLRLVTNKLSQKSSDLGAATERLTALVELGLQLGSERDPQRLLQGFCDAAREIIGARAAVVGVAGMGPSPASTPSLPPGLLLTSGMDAATLQKDEGGRMKDESKPSGSSFILPPSSFSSGVLGMVLAECRSLRLSNPGGDPAALGLPPGFPPCRSFLGVPLVSPSRVHGWLCLLDKIGAEEFSPEDERLASILAAQTGRIYENDLLYADVLRHAAELEKEAAARRRAEERLQHVLASSPAVLFTLTVSGHDLHPTWVSANVRELWGYPAEDVCRPGWWTERVHPDDLPRVQASLRNDLFARGHLVDEHRFRHRDGTYRWVQSDLRLLRDPAGQPAEVVGSWSDVSQRKLLEDQFRQAQKMEAVGRLAGGVAHDFNNLLTVINGYGELVLGRLPAGDPTRELVREVVAAGDRAAALTRQLLAFSRKAILEPKVLDLKAVVADVGEMLRRLIGEDVRLAVATDPGPGLVRVDPGQLEQVLMNLAVNARDAMPQGGLLTLEVRNVVLDASYVRDHAEARAGPHVLLAVSDTGSGIDAVTLTRIWDPFFTTKGDKGTGLGLATVYGIVKQSGGHVAVYSEVGHGTTFKVYLPREEKRPVSGKSVHGLTAMPRGTETVLLVEDEDAVRALARHVLQVCGYVVLEARDGAEALRLAGQHSGRIDLLATDVVLPRRGGREVAERLTALHPGLKVLFLSGYTEDAVVRHGILEAQVAFLQKPFTPALLAAKVREVLDSR